MDKCDLGSSRCTIGAPRASRIPLSRKHSSSSVCVLIPPRVWRRIGQATSTNFTFFLFLLSRRSVTLIHVENRTMDPVQRSGVEPRSVASERYTIEPRSSFFDRAHKFSQLVFWSVLFMGRTRIILALLLSFEEINRIYIQGAI